MRSTPLHTAAHLSRPALARWIVCALAALALAGLYAATLQTHISGSFGETSARNILLAYAERLRALDTDAIPPTAAVLPLRNVLRPDVVEPSLPRDEALANAPDSAGGQFRVDAILDSA
ncbi:MAG: aspartyl/glutamyl-tRNA amidotransferase subunit C [Anaerolineae bacterium]|nr:aspartyl/glutamyl-tRNA amidotransferase subunit C [Anaerolineae bacterium]